MRVLMASLSPFEFALGFGWRTNKVIAYLTAFRRTRWFHFEMHRLDRAPFIELGF